MIETSVNFFELANHDVEEGVKHASCGITNQWHSVKTCREMQPGELFIEEMQTRLLTVRLP